MFEYHLFHKKLTARSSPSAATHVSSPHTQPQPTLTFMFHFGHVTTLANRRDWWYQCWGYLDWLGLSHSPSLVRTCPPLVVVSRASTPNLGSSFVWLPLLLHKEATKKLYEGLGIGHHHLPAASTLSVTVLQCMLSQPVRQSRRPPFGADELSPRNFATHIRCKATDNLSCRWPLCAERLPRLSMLTLSQLTPLHSPEGILCAPHCIYNTSQGL